MLGWNLLPDIRQLCAEQEWFVAFAEALVAGDFPQPHAIVLLDFLDSAGRGSEFADVLIAARNRLIEQPETPGTLRIRATRSHALPA